MSPKKLHSFLLDRNLTDGLKRLKQLEGVSEGETVRRALTAYLTKKGVIKAERKRAITRKRP